LSFWFTVSIAWRESRIHVNLTDSLKRIQDSCHFWHTSPSFQNNGITKILKLSLFLYLQILFVSSDKFWLLCFQSSC
jgi:hypothetical protein